MDTGAPDSLAPAVELRKIGIPGVGPMSYELADEEMKDCGYRSALIEFMGEITAGRVIFGEDRFSARHCLFLLLSRLLLRLGLGRLRLALGNRGGHCPA